MSSTVTPTTDNTQTLAALLDTLGVSISFTRNPSVDAASKKQFEWKWTLERKGRFSKVTGTYFYGIAHADLSEINHRDRPNLAGYGNNIYRQEVLDAIVRSQATGERVSSSWLGFLRVDVWPTPTAVSLIQTLAYEYDVMDYPTFEAWAFDYGCDPDSRKAEAIYNASLRQAVGLRAVLGDATVQQIRELVMEM